MTGREIGPGRVDRPLGDVQRRRLLTSLGYAKALELGLDLIDAAVGAVTADLAVEQVRRLGESWDADTARAVAAVLAVEAVWKLPPPPFAVPVSDVTVHTRQQQLVEWSWGRRQRARQTVERLTDVLARRGGQCG